jgi:hypothetical protein
VDGRFVGLPGHPAGSIRVLSGEVESIGATAVTFKLKGISGERIAFTFQKK